MTTPTPESWMQRALALARQGEGLTRPNPPVGAVCVRRGRMVGEGFHRRAGGPHAEVEALAQAGAKARGATLYVTLEPCSTHGRTPPCVDAILRAGVREVVVAQTDPNPKHRGRGLRILRRADVKVITGVEQEAGAELLAPFATWVTSGRPLVRLKLGMTVDGKLADRTTAAKWITGPVARREVQAMRRQADAILVGSGTLRLDNPSLIPRPAKGRKPFRVVVSGSGRLPLEARVFNDQAAAQTIVATTEACPSRTVASLERRGVTVLSLRRKGAGVSLRLLLRDLGRRGVMHLLCEGGGRLAETLVREDLVDVYDFFISPKVLSGPAAADAFHGAGWLLPEAPELVFGPAVFAGRDLHLTAKPLRRA